MIRNALAIVGAVAILGYFRGALIPKIPLLGRLPLPQITFNSDADKPSNPNKPGEPNQPAIAPTSPTPQPTTTPDQKKRWGLEFEYKGRVGL